MIHYTNQYNHILLPKELLSLPILLQKRLLVTKSIQGFEKKVPTKTSSLHTHTSLQHLHDPKQYTLYTQYTPHITISDRREKNQTDS